MKTTNAGKVDTSSAININIQPTERRRVATPVEQLIRLYKRGIANVPAIMQITVAKKLEKLENRVKFP